MEEEHVNVCRLSNYEDFVSDEIGHDQIKDE